MVGGTVLRAAVAAASVSASTGILGVGGWEASRGSPGGRSPNAPESVHLRLKGPGLPERELKMLRMQKRQGSKKKTQEEEAEAEKKCVHQPDGKTKSVHSVSVENSIKRTWLDVTSRWILSGVAHVGPHGQALVAAQRYCNCTSSSAYGCMLANGSLSYPEDFRLVRLPL